MDFAGHAHRGVRVGAGLAGIRWCLPGQGHQPSNVTSRTDNATVPAFPEIRDAQGVAKAHPYDCQLLQNTMLVLPFLPPNGKEAQGF